jgi:hypothetical protein
MVLIRSGTGLRRVTRGKLGAMHQTDRETPMDDAAHRSENDDPRTEQAPAIRLLANPRRVRRA